jgi:hypothetical protein
VRTILRQLLVLTVLLTSITGARAQTPTIEYSSLLRGFSMGHETRRLGFQRLWGAFFPEESINRGQANGPAQEAFLVIKRGGSEVYRNPFYVGAWHTVWTEVRPTGTAINFVFEEPGDYSYGIELDGKTIAEVPFTLTMKGSGDPFNPVKMGFVDGPWSKLAYLSLPEKSNPEKLPTFAFWDRAGVLAGGKNVRVRMEVRQDGDTVFVSRPAVVSGDKNGTGWKEFKLNFDFLKADGGGAAPLKAVTKKDGTYQVILFHDDQPWKLFRFEVASGAMVPHARSAWGYEPHTDFLVGRTPDKSEAAAHDLIWMEVESAEALAAAVNKAAAPVAAASAADRAAWVATPTSPASRAAKLTLTSANARMDAGLAVGDDIIAWATGSIKGVSWMRVGEDTEHTLPGGQDFHSKHFFVCGKKIVMLRGAQVVVFDTETETLSEIPETEVSVAKSFLDNYKGNKIAADGFLVATLSDPKKVDDRVIAKVVDVSGPAPRVIALKNTELAVGDIDSIAVDAATGKVAMGSNRSSALFVADVAPRAVFERLDLSSIDGYGRDATPMLKGGWLTYFDDSGSKPKLRLIELATKRTQTLPAIGKSYRCYAVTASKLAFATTESRGSEYAIAIGAPGQRAGYPEGAGTSLAGTSAMVGYGSSVAIAGNLVFIAGQGKSGVGSGEFLQVSDGTGWKTILGSDGKPLPAVDVVASGRLVAFKTGKRNDTKVGYMVLGAQAKLDELP